MKRTPLVFLAITAGLCGLLGGMLATGIAQAARDSSGTYTLYSGNPVSNGATITHTLWNTTFNDLASELTDSLSRSNKGAMLAVLRHYDGTQAAPGITWASDTDTGCWRVGANDMACGAGNTKTIEWTTATVTTPVGLTIGSSGTAISKSVAATSTIDVANVTAKTCLDTTVTVTGAAAGAPCVVGAPTAAAANAAFTCYVSATDTVKLRACPLSDSDVDPASGSYQFRVFNP